MVLLIFGRTTCGNTRNMITQAERLVDMGISLKPVIMLIDNTGETSISDFAAEHPKCIVSDNYGTDYSNDPNLKYANDLENILNVSSGVLPLTFLMNKERHIVCAALGPQNTNKMVTRITMNAQGDTGSLENEAAGMIKATVSVNYYQEEARSMLAMVNEFRTGSEAWAWNSSDTEKVQYPGLNEFVYDYDLEKIAIQRAEELISSYSHTRPDGTSCFTAYTGKFAEGSKGENIAYGYESAEDVFEAWREDNDSYSGQGHRRNMLGAYKSIGIACVVYNGRKYWVQEFSSETVNQNAVEYDENSRYIEIPLNPETTSLDGEFMDTRYYWDNTAEIDVGETIDCPFVRFFYVTGSSRIFAGLIKAPVSSNPAVADIESEMYGGEETYSIRGKKSGTAVMNYVGNYNGLKAGVNLFVTVIGKDLQSIALDKTSLSLAKGKSQTLTVAYTPADTTDDKTVTWSTSNNSVATVSGGKVTAVGTGTATITAKVGTKTAACKVTVTIPLTSIKLSNSTLNLTKGASKKLTVTYTPTDTTDSKTVTWSSSDKTVATVSGGTVKAVGGGTATITAKVGTKTATCKVTVKVPLESISLNKK